MKKQNLTRILLSVSVIVLIVISCKKNDSNENPLNAAKAWYQKETAKSIIALKSNQGGMEGIKRDVLWNNAKTFTLDNGSELVGVPIKVTLANGKANGSYMLFISKNNGSYTSLVTYNEKKDYFNGALSNSEIQQVYRNATNLNAAHKNNAVKANKGMSAMQTEHKGEVMLENNNPIPCIDWYWTTTIYDDWGDILSYTETYLYTTCEDPNPGGGGGAPPPPPDNDCSDVEAKISGSQTSINMGSSLIEENATTRKKEYTWKFLQSLLWYYTSKEVGVHKKVGDAWQWQSLTHSRTFLSGTVVGGTLTLTVNSSTPTIGTYVAGMTINYDFYGAAMCKGSPFSYSRPNVTQDSPVWDSTID